MPASVRTLSQLPGIVYQQLDNKSKFEVSVPVEVSVINSQDIIYKFASKSITAEEVSKKISVDIRNGLIESNGLSEGVRIDDLCAFVSAVAYSDFTFDGTKDYLENPTIDNSPLSSYSLTDDTLNDYSVNYGTLKKYSNINCSPSIGPNFGFVTRLSGFQSGSHQTERMLNIFKPVLSDTEGLKFSSAPYFVFNTNAKNVVPNEYIFKIEPGKRESKSWVAPASGIFTCYGWLDEINNPSQANESRWVALMGKQAQLLEKGWSILQVQPFIKNNYLSYVGFTFPVKKGMELKIVTGFAVGNNSDKYFSSNSSLANHIGNAFLGGIYTGLSADDGSGNNYDYGKLSDETNVYLTSADLSDLWNHEASCDLSVKELIDDLSSKLSNNVVSDTEDRVRYINPYVLSGDNPITYSRIRFGIGSGQNHNQHYGVFDANVKQCSIINGEPVEYVCPRLDIGFSNRSSGLGGLQYRNYYAPPTKTEIRDNRTGYIEQGYFLDDFPGGTVASDGQYFYYKVLQNSTVLIKFSHDVLSPGINTIKGWLLYDLNRGYANIKALPILEKVECGSFNGYPSESITLPLSADSILMFGIYSRERLDLPFYTHTLQPPVLTEANLIVPAQLTALKYDPAYLSCSYRNYKNSNMQNVTRLACLLNADGSNINSISGPKETETKYALSGFSFGDLCYVYELP